MIADISHYQGEINWAAARKDLQLCIFRASVGSNKDNKYLSYAKNCGIPFGVYHYVKAGTASEAEAEAKFFYETATQNNIQPLFFVADIEYETQTKSTTKPVTLAFCNTLRELGAKKVGLYIGQSRYPYIEDSLNEFDFIWIPRYGKNTGYADETYKPKYPCDLWQYTSEGSVEGISGNVDLNKLNGTKTLEWFLSSTEIKQEEQKPKEEVKPMSKKMPIGVFVAELRKAVDRKDGYIMGSTGQNPKKWSATSWWFTQYSGSQKTKALYWRANAQRVWDCNGLAEGLYKDYTGIDINTKARYNYSGWCSKKGTGMIPVNMRVPGAAIFWGSKAASITHVAYLDRPVVDGKPEGDWYIIEARGVMYGVVRTKLYARDPDFWGIMDKYFDYGITDYVEPSYKLGDRLLKKGAKGSDVSELQTWLTKFGYLKDIIDGDFGSNTKKAVEKFQKANGLTADGEYGPQSHKAMLALIESQKVAEEEKEEEKKEEQKPTVKEGQIVVTGSSVNIRRGDSTNFEKIGTVNKGEKLSFVLNEEKKAIVSINGWYAVHFENSIGWISGKYAEQV